MALTRARYGFSNRVDICEAERANGRLIDDNPGWVGGETTGEVAALHDGKTQCGHIVIVDIKYIGIVQTFFAPEFLKIEGRGLWIQTDAAYKK